MPIRLTQLGPAKQPRPRKTTSAKCKHAGIGVPGHVRAGLTMIVDAPISP